MGGRSLIPRTYHFNVKQFAADGVFFRVRTPPHVATVASAAREHVMDPNFSQRSRSAAQLPLSRRVRAPDRAITLCCGAVLPLPALTVRSRKAGGRPL